MVDISPQDQAHQDSRREAFKIEQYFDNSENRLRNAKKELEFTDDRSAKISLLKKIVVESAVDLGEALGQHVALNALTETF